MGLARAWLLCRNWLLFTSVAASENGMFVLFVRTMSQRLHARDHIYIFGQKVISSRAA
jgi:hypothetical protein